MLQDKRIILGICGSIAAYKAVYLLRLLKKAGATVKVVTTPAVSQFIGELTLSSLSGQKVFSGLWNEEWSAHVALGTQSDLMIVAPATANTLAKFAHGLCDNALTAVYLAARCPVLVAPAMDADMFIHPRTTANLAQLSEDGVQVLPVGNGFLASGLEGPGRMEEPEAIFEAVKQYFLDGPLTGKKILLSAGPTAEALDPVRYLTNRSSGKMGYALAKVARGMGAAVTLVSGPTNLARPEGVHFVAVRSAEDMRKAVQAHRAEQDAIIMAAAVADYTPANVAEHKVKKSGGNWNLPLKRTTDILRELGEQKPEGQILVGFALETQDEHSNARKKLEKKNLDFIVLNSLQDKGAGFGHDTNRITILDKQGEEKSFPLKSKQEVAKDILQHLSKLFP
ncbi:MAG: bifunctional phosphopantothenoylcysteine decarboxylase/phosphopantothenate--cysteine ligase CoaBC [Bacteroidota bacterium]